MGKREAAVGRANICIPLSALRAAADTERSAAKIDAAAVLPSSILK